ncbi:MAG: hypothetical protein ACNA7W_06075 [Pseudomonadales bacterium]
MKATLLAVLVTCWGLSIGGPAHAAPPLTPQQHAEIRLIVEQQRITAEQQHIAELRRMAEQQRTADRQRLIDQQRAADQQRATARIDLYGLYSSQRWALDLDDRTRALAPERHAQLETQPRTSTFHMLVPEVSVSK